MLEHARRRKLWEKTKLFNARQLDRAQSVARTSRCSMDEALVRLRYAEYPQLGRALSAAFSMPFTPLFPARPADEARRQLPVRCASHWGAFPVSYDGAGQALTLAVSDPSMVPHLEAVFRLLMQPHALAFSVASDGEIRAALREHCHYDPTVLKVPGKWKLRGLRAPQAAVAAAPAEGGGPARRRAPEPAPAKMSEELRHCMTGAATLLVEAYLGEDTEPMNLVRSRVRHAECLATRLGFSQDELNRLALASWLSGLCERRSVVRQFETPYDLEAVIYPPAGGKPQPREALALSLVRCYEALGRSDRDAARDVNRTRRHLQLVWSSASETQEMLETFLQILIDERFFANLDRAAGRVLVVGDSGAAASSPAALLCNSGYTVQAVPSAGAATAAISGDRPDLAVICSELPEGSGLDFCRALKAGDATRGLPVLMLLPPSGAGRAAEALRAGADDFLVQPVDRDLLLLKLEKLAARRSPDAQKTGVSGSLADLAFTDMIQILCAGGRNIEITLARGVDEGRVFVKNGAVVHAVCGALEGEKAFFRLMRWCDGEFTTRECREFPRETISCSAMSLLMEGARRFDEQEPGA